MTFPSIRRIRLLTLLLAFFITVSSQAGEVPSSELPPVTADPDRLSEAASIPVRAFRFEGNTVFSDAELHAITGPWEGRTLSADELEAARKALTAHYVDAGYVNSGAVIPDQRMAGGVVLVRIVEGRLTGMNVSGVSWLRPEWITDRVELATGDGPLNLERLRDRLAILKQDPKLENIGATLRPGERPGEAILDVEVAEARPYHGEIFTDNHKSPAIGSWRGGFRFWHDDLTGWGDRLELSWALTEGLDEYRAAYIIPLNRHDATLTLRVERDESTVREYPFDQLDIESETTTWGLEGYLPLSKTVEGEFGIGLALEKRDSETKLLDRGFPFSEGVEDNGESSETVTRLYGQWARRDPLQVLALRAEVSAGWDLFGATTHEDEADGRFVAALIQFQWLRRLDFLNSQILFRAGLRLADDPLLPAEKFGIGGADTVRGYRENQITTDNGALGSLEWRIPVTRLPIPGLSRSRADGGIFLCPFLDAGAGWNTSRPDPSDKELSSLGVGLRWEIGPGTHAECYWGHALREVSDSTEYDLQDDGIHFRFVAALF